MKKLLTLLALVSLIVCGESLTLEKFDNGADGKPRGWYLNAWSGYLPLADLKVVPGGDDGRNSLKVSNVTAESGGAIVSSKRYPVRCGDLIRFNFRARGKGVVSLRLGLFQKDGKWSSISNEHYDFSLSESWNDYIGAFRVGNGYLGETFSAYITFSFRKGVELELSSLSAEKEEGIYRGSVKIPVKWRVFGPVDKSYIPNADQLKTVPTEFGGCHGDDATLNDNTLDFGRLLGPGAYKCAWAFAELTAPYDFEYTVGAGADWWMQYFLNGEKVFDTMENGNVLSPVAMNNYIATVHVKKGVNVFAIKFVSGAASSKLYLGGPLELSQIVSNIKLSKIEWIESFDGKECACTGNSELIIGNPTPGLLTQTGQGVFRAKDGKVDIVPVVPSWSAVDGDFRALNVRIQNFGRENRLNSELAFVFDGEKGQSFYVTIEHKADNGVLRINAKDGLQAVGSYSISYDELPADFIIAGNADGKYAIQVNSLVQSKSTIFMGDAPFFKNSKSMRPRLEFKSADSNAEVVIDNYIIGRASEDKVISKVPYIVKPESEFDPVKAGWKKVFDEEFDGDSLDLNKWFHAYSSKPERLEVKDGLCKITCDWTPDKTKVTSASINTMQKFGYGYYEARIKFRKEHGWWSAFWICGYSCSNPFYDSFEIDIYEDYYLRSEKPGGEPRRTLDHNLHINVGGCLKSWNYNSTLPGDLDQFYTIGCKWTPFEISYYMEGKLIKSSANHSPYNSVTFDAFNHSAGFTPMHAILSGCCGKSGGDPKDGNFPESFYCDFVRIYEFPQENIPSVKWTEKPEEAFMVKPGTKLKFSAEAQASAKTGSKIRHAYLFDSGFLLDNKSEPPYNFEVLLSKEYFDTTEYVRKGRQGKVPEFGPQLHAFSIFVQDEAGEVAHTEPHLIFIAPERKSAPFKGIAQKLPGRLALADYDEGGQNVAYYDASPGNSFKGRSETRLDEDVDVSGTTVGGMMPWEWLNYTVDIETAGEYTAKLHYGTPMPSHVGMMLLVDGTEVGRFKLPRHKDSGFTVDQFTECSVKLPSGRHLITLIALSSGANMDYIEFTVK
ncbi:MAG: family 16 glycosylhydrolase [Victivallales bacterium]|nr:family 16 glycosylhydrolase [Victivallales bacterium]